MTILKEQENYQSVRIVAWENFRIEPKDRVAKDKKKCVIGMRYDIGRQVQ